MKRAAVLIVALALAGCASSYVPSSPPADHPANPNAATALAPSASTLLELPPEEPLPPADPYGNVIDRFPTTPRTEPTEGMDHEGMDHEGMEHDMHMHQEDQ